MSEVFGRVIIVYGMCVFQVEMHKCFRPGDIVVARVVSLSANQCIHFYEEFLKTVYLQPFNGLFSRTTWVGRYQKDKPFGILLKQRWMGRQWQQLDQQVICTSLQTDSHDST